MTIKINHTLQTISATDNTLPITIDADSSLILPITNNALEVPASIVFDNTIKQVKYHNGTEWVILGSINDIATKANKHTASDLAQNPASVNKYLSTNVAGVPEWKDPESDGFMRFNKPTVTIPSRVVFNDIATFTKNINVNNNTIKNVKTGGPNDAIPKSYLDTLFNNAVNSINHDSLEKYQLVLNDYETIISAITNAPEIVFLVVGSGTNVVLKKKIDELLAKEGKNSSTYTGTIILVMQNNARFTSTSPSTPALRFGTGMNKAIKFVFLGASNWFATGANGALGRGGNGGNGGGLGQSNGSNGSNGGNGGNGGTGIKLDGYKVNLSIDALRSRARGGNGGAGGTGGGGGGGHHYQPGYQSGGQGSGQRPTIYDGGGGGGGGIGSPNGTPGRGGQGNHAGDDGRNGSGTQGGVGGGRAANGGNAGKNGGNADGIGGKAGKPGANGSAGIAVDPN